MLPLRSRRPKRGRCLAGAWQVHAMQVRLYRANCENGVGAKNQNKKTISLARTDLFSIFSIFFYFIFFIF